MDIIIETDGDRTDGELVEGIMYCRKHDDFAIEGYDWSDVCHEAYAEDIEDGCELVSMYVEESRDFQP